MRIVQLKQGTPEWHAWRAGGIGSSDMPVLFGVSRFKTRHELWLEKQGFARKDDGNDYIKARGHQHEKTLRAYAEELLDEPLAVTCVQGDRPWQRVSLDGIRSDKRIVVEAKMMKADAFVALRDKREAPAEYLPQVAHQLASADEAESCLFVGLNEKMGEKAHVYVPRNAVADMIAKSVELGDAFWKLVEDGKEPEPEGDEIVVVTDDQLLDAARRYARIKRLADRVEARQKELADQLKAALADGKRKAVIGDLSMIRFPRKGNVDYSKVPELQGVDLEAYRKKGSMQIRIDV